MPNILVSTLGLSWAILPELLAFTNPEQVPLYNFHRQAEEFACWRRQYDIQPVEEVWIVTTAGENVQRGLQALQQWIDMLNLPRLNLQVLSSSGLENLASDKECLQMRDLIFRTVFHARARADTGQIVLSLAGGRKTMSADMQEAGNIFGCQALLHVVDDGNLPPEVKNPKPDFLAKPLPPEIANHLSPIVIAGKREPSPTVFAEPPLKTEQYPLPLEISAPPQEDFAEEIARRNRSAGALLCNFISRISNSEGSGFYSLYGLPPKQLNDLREYRLGKTLEQLSADYQWLLKIPKAELHCHLGGILSPQEIIQVAKKSQQELEELILKHPDLAAWQKEIENAVQTQDREKLLPLIKNKTLLRQAIENIPEPFCLITFVLAFQNKPDFLAELIYCDYPTEDSFQGIDIDNYERLGDLQGSGLLQNEESIRETCKILIQHCQQQNIIYLELRCSPMNYTRGGLSGEEVVAILLEELKNCLTTHFTLIFIASRHGKMSEVYRQIELSTKLLEDDLSKEAFQERFVGFDLAGAEKARSPRELREAFSNLHKKCLNITIHAGETEEADSIWEAVYFLNAQRIGHGLSLQKNQELLNLIKNRRIAVEMCPSSNGQICKFQDNLRPQTANYEQYPLQKYLQEGLRVTICTDNPGISKTDLSQEYLKAARLSKKGISKWEALRICRNAFQASFAPFKIKREILLKAETQIINILEVL